MYRAILKQKVNKAFRKVTPASSMLSWNTSLSLVEISNPNLGTIVISKCYLFSVFHFSLFRIYNN